MQELNTFANLPGEAIVSYSGPRPTLPAVLVHVASVGSPALVAMAAGARAYAAMLAWPEIAMRTQNEMESLLGLANEADGPQKADYHTGSHMADATMTSIMQRTAVVTCGHARRSSGRRWMGLTDFHG